MSLSLDTRQRAMLAEMGVRVWMPEPAASAAVTVQASSAPVAAAVATPPAQVMPAIAQILPQALPVAPNPAPIPAPLPTPVAAPALELDTLTWSALQEAAQSCQACGLCRTRKQVVFGAGAVSEPEQTVDWLIVAESPNEDEQTQGHPFVGEAGQLLDNMLKACELSRTPQPGRGRAFVTHAVKCSPPGARNPQVDEQAQCRAYLLRQIQLLRPRMILAMGRLAANALLQDSVPQVQATPLGKLRSQVYQCQSTPVVVTFHPAYVMRSPGEKGKVWADLCLAMAHLKGEPSSV